MVESLAPRVNFVESRLTADHMIRAKKSWIEECLRFFISQAPEIDDESLYQQALEQFLLADVAEASNPVIPAPIHLKKEPFTLNGTFVVQLLFLIDISESPYEQWRRLYNIRLDDVEEKGHNKQFQPKKKRMFKLELTDGVRTVSSLEYVQIPALTSKIAPGVKLKIVGPLQVVNHILLLEPKNVVVLGGDVDSLLVVNAYENVLLRALGKPTTETPITDYNENEVNQDVARDYSHIIPKPMSSLSHSNNSNSLQQKVAQDLLEGIDFGDEDEIDLEMLMQIEQQQNVRPPVVQSNRVTTNQLDEEDDEMLAELDFEMLEENARRNMEGTEQVIEVEDYRPVVNRRPNIQSNEVIEIEDIRPTIRNLPVQTIVIPDELIEASTSSLGRDPSSTDPVPKKIARTEPTRKLEVSDDNYEFKTVQGNNIVTVDQYNSLSQNNKLKKAYVVFARVEKVLDKTLKISMHNFFSCVEISDHYSHGILSVKFHTSVMEKLAGYSARELVTMKKNSVQQPPLQEDIISIIENLYTAISKLECFMKVEMKCPPKFEFQVTELLDSTSENDQKFKKKVKEENLSKVD